MESHFGLVAHHTDDEEAREQASLSEVPARLHGRPNAASPAARLHRSTLPPPARPAGRCSPVPLQHPHHRPPQPPYSAPRAAGSRAPTQRGGVQLQPRMCATQLSWRATAAACSCWRPSGAAWRHSQPGGSMTIRACATPQLLASKPRGAAVARGARLGRSCCEQRDSSRQRQRRPCRAPRRPALLPPAGRPSPFHMRPSSRASLARLALPPCNHRDLLPPCNHREQRPHKVACRGGVWTTCQTHATASFYAGWINR
jgi:hypothetical protein